MKKLIILFVANLVVFGLSAQSINFLTEYFVKNQIKGTMVIMALDSSAQFVYNPERANEAFLPASTFKIPNTLISLQEKVITDENEVIKWDGHSWEVKDWNHDQSLQSAFKVSCVWFYQELAKRVGNETYLTYLKKMHYGNELTGPEVSLFWLAGDIRISAWQQIAFLKTVYNQTGPFDQRNYQILKRIMLTDSTADYKIYTKTGWAARVEQEIGWYVGYVETKGKVWIFACNLDINDPAQAVYRKQIAYQGLREAGIIPKE